MVVLILGYGLHNSEYLILIFNPIPTGLGHVTLIYGLIPPMVGRDRVKSCLGKNLPNFCSRAFIYKMN